MQSRSKTADGVEERPQVPIPLTYISVRSQHTEITNIFNITPLFQPLNLQNA